MSMLQPAAWSSCCTSAGGITNLWRAAFVDSCRSACGGGGGSSCVCWSACRCCCWLWLLLLLATILLTGVVKEAMQRGDAWCRGGGYWDLRSRCVCNARLLCVYCEV